MKMLGVPRQRRDPTVAGWRFEDVARLANEEKVDDSSRVSAFKLPAWGLAPACVLELKPRECFSAMLSA